MAGGNKRQLYCQVELEPHEGKVRLEMKPQRLKPLVKYLVCRKLSGGEKATKEDEIPFYIPHKSISRRHALLWCKPHVEGGLELRLRDLGTTNGTFVNGERLAPGGLATKIVGGDGRLVFRLGEIPHKFRAWCVLGEDSPPRESISKRSSQPKKPSSKALKAEDLRAKATRLAQIEDRIAAAQGASGVPGTRAADGQAPTPPTEALQNGGGLSTPEPLLDLGKPSVLAVDGGDASPAGLLSTPDPLADLVPEGIDGSLGHVADDVNASEPLADDDMAAMVPSAPAEGEEASRHRPCVYVSRGYSGH